MSASEQPPGFLLNPPELLSHWKRCRLTATHEYDKTQSHSDAPAVPSLEAVGPRRTTVC